ncbi:MAG: DNA-3-methyladenine glycosylase 2 family protein [Lachnospiraceae bacterium]|nr:DNA-3-methyladenine glycosylase 2 family protein [Lachnospiraceae bacterium]
MEILINDDFDLDKITNSGQAFRIKVFEDGRYRFVTENHILYIKKNNNAAGKHYDIEMFSAESRVDSEKNAGTITDSATFSATAVSSLEEWDTVWVPYFDLDRSYSSIRSLVPANDKYLKLTADYGIGLRILKQNPWEMLITFIISQRKNIPAIKESVEKICRAYGRTISTPYEEFSLFPSADEMSAATLEELRKCSLGYRDTYILDAVDRVTSGKLALESLGTEDYDTIFNSLLEVRGVGAKVSNCICLFAYAQFSAAPVDTWIAKVIDKYYNGINPFPSYGDVAGIMQQYIFYYAQTHKEDF